MKAVSPVGLDVIDLLGAALFATALLVPASASAQEPTVGETAAQRVEFLPPPGEEDPPVPPGYRVEYRPRKVLIGTGVGVFAFFYGVSIVGAFADMGADNTGAEPLFIPIAGPFVTIATKDLKWKHDKWGFDRLGIIMLVADGVAQSIGATLAIAGIASGKARNLVREDRGTRAPEVLIGAGSGSLRWRF